MSGREQIVAHWLGDRDPPGSWAAAYRPWVTDGGDAVAVGVSRYLGPDGVAVEREYHNVFLCRFDADGRCTEFTEYYMRRPDSLSPEREHALAGSARTDERHDDSERSLHERDVRLCGVR